MSNEKLCSICGKKHDIFKCSNEKCEKLVCFDCSQDYIMPMMQFFLNEPLPILKCPNCGQNLIRKF